MNNDFKHYSVMAKEAIDSLNCQNNKIYVDATLGGGGYSELILQKIQPNGLLIAFDVDDDAISAATERLKCYKNLKIVKDSYSNIKENLQKLNVEKITGGIVFDLGASYYQLTSVERGFSFLKNAPLDMRFDKNADFTAYDVINSYTEKDLVDIFQNYGEERFSKRIAKSIVNTRKIATIKTTVDLAQLIQNSTPKIKSNIHPATRVFQAVRIEVNHELQNIKKTLNDVVTLLDVNAIISVVSFHSLEDRIVKQFFKSQAAKCRCEKNQPVCACGGAQLEIITKKPLVATENEIRENRPSRSAKLRTARRI